MPMVVWLGIGFSWVSVTTVFTAAGSAALGAGAAGFFSAFGSAFFAGFAAAFFSVGFFCSATGFLLAGWVAALVSPARY